VGIVTKAGAGTLKLTGSLAACDGLRVDAGTVDAAVTQTLKALTIGSGGGGVAVVSAGVLTVGDGKTAAPLNLGAGATAGHLDLTTRGLVVDFSTAADPQTALAGVRAQLLTAYDDGAWDGRGIGSSSVGSDTSKSIGYGLSTEILGPTGGTFLGKSGVDATAVLVRYTLAGDATLNGAVDFNDLVTLAQNYNSSVTSASGSGWVRGDSTYDGVVDFNDLVKLAQNYNTAIPAEPIPGAPASFDDDLARAFAEVPEPSGATALAACLACLSRPRRRRL
jgi:hypothetical protein